MWPEMVCRFGDGAPALVAVYTPEGCVCFPEDRQQLLCPQHFVNFGMVGDDVEVLWVHPLLTVHPRFEGYPTTVPGSGTV